MNGQGFSHQPVMADEVLKLLEPFFFLIASNEGSMLTCRTLFSVSMSSTRTWHSSPILCAAAALGPFLLLDGVLVTAEGAHT